MSTLHCEKTMNSFLELDKNERLPLSVTLHLLTCKKCRTEVRMLTLAEKKSSQPFTVSAPFTEQTLLHIMKQVDPTFSPKKWTIHPVTFKRWIFSGVFMILMMLSFRWITGSMLDKTSLMVAFYSVFGSIVTVYCAVFIGSNLDFFIKKIYTRFSLPTT